VPNEETLMAASLALAAGEKLAQAVSNDIVVLNGRLYRTVRVGRKKVLEPVDVQLHINPAGIGLGLLTGAIGLFAADLAWNGLHFGLPGLEFDIIKGLKESPYWQGVAGKLTKGKAGKLPPPAPPGAPPGGVPFVGPFEGGFPKQPGIPLSEYYLRKSQLKRAEEGRFGGL
jgi:hypothetical protein